MARTNVKEKAKAKPRAKGEETWKELKPGMIITEPGSSAKYKTGDWKIRRPEVDLKKCTKCTLCYYFCPEGCIAKTEDGYYLADLFYCKGCGICAAECPKDAITMVEEER